MTALTFTVAFREDELLPSWPNEARLLGER
jgi:hypothetical protein